MAKKSGSDDASPPVKGKLSFLQPESSKHVDSVPKPSGGTLPRPSTTGREWAQLATQLLNAHHPDTATRAIEVCEAAATALMDEARHKEAAAARSRRGSATRGGTGGHTQQYEVGDEGAFNPRDREADDVGAHDAEEGDGQGRARRPATPERVEAAHALVAGCVAALDRNTAGSVVTAVSLARRACEVWSAPMCSLALAWAHYRASAKLPERGAQDVALSCAAAAAASAAAALLRKRRLDPEDTSRLARAAWMLAALGEGDGAQLCVNRLLAKDPQHLMGLLLLVTLHTAAGDTDSALAACVRLAHEHPQDIAGALLLTTLRRSIGAGSVQDDGEDTLVEELGVALARVQQFAADAVVVERQSRKRSLQSFCIHPAPGEVKVGDGPSTSGPAAQLTAQEACGRAAGYWALLAMLCVRLGAFPMAEVVIEAGLQYVAAAKFGLYRRVFADLLCCRARMALMKLSATVPPAAPSHGVLREVDLLGHIQAPCGAAGGGAGRTAPHTLFALCSEVRGAAVEAEGPDVGLAGPLREEPLADASRLLSSRDLGSIFTYLLKAAEAYREHAESRHLMGVVRLLEASQPDLPKRAVEQKRASAVSFFTEAIRMAPMYVEPQLGLGCVREAQGATDVALDVYASAAELRLHEPLIPYDCLLFLFE